MSLFFGNIQQIVGGGSYTYYTGTTILTADGDIIISANTYLMEYLLVGGGGGSGKAEYDYQTRNSYSGGGGSGGLLTGTISNPTAGTYAVVVGAGGDVKQANVTGSNGGNSTFYGLTAYGGGYGAGVSGEINVTDTGGNGGSGGGGAAIDQQTETVGGNGTSGQGYNGSKAEKDYLSSRGGAGGGSGGQASTYSGGAGTSSSITGSAVTYAVGGSAQQNGTSRINGTAGTANTGNGASGARSSLTSIGAGAIGGSGIVVVKIYYYA